MAPAVATYAPRDPSQTVLYTVIAEHLETFLASLADDPEATGQFCSSYFPGLDWATRGTVMYRLESPALAMGRVKVYYSPRRFCHVAVPLSFLLSLALILVGCVSWTHPTKPATAFADDAAACEAAAAQEDPTTVGNFDIDHYNAYITCLRGKGWELQQRP